MPHSISSQATAAAAPAGPKKVQMQLRIKCYDKTCDKKFLTKLALNTHCKKKHPEIMKQRALREQQDKMAALRARVAADKGKRCCKTDGQPYRRTDR